MARMLCVSETDEKVQLNLYVYPATHKRLVQLAATYRNHPTTKRGGATKVGAEIVEKYIEDWEIEEKRRFADEEARRAAARSKLTPAVEVTHVDANVPKGVADGTLKAESENRGGREDAA
jgi:hypothetical protein